MPAKSVASVIERNRRRAQFARQPRELRELAVDLMPMTPRLLGQKVRLRRATIERLVDTVDRTTDPTAKAALATELNNEVRALSRLLSIGKKRKARRGKKPLRMSRPKVVQASVPREELPVPLAYDEPLPGEAVMLLRLVARSMQRVPGEDDAMMAVRLRAMTQRALGRFIAARSSGAEVPDAFTVAVNSTIASDTAPILSEMAAGGLAQDPAADSMDRFIEPVSSELLPAVEDFHSDVPGGTPSREEINAILDVAEQLEKEAAASEPTSADDVATDILFADESADLPTAAELPSVSTSAPQGSGLSFPLVAVGAVGGLALLWYFTRSRQ